MALGRAMAREPRVFLMDDPLSQLDAAHRAANHKELRDLHRQLGVTIIYVTQDQTEAMALSNRIGVMNAGVLQQVGTPQSLYEHPANLFVAGFIGSPPMNTVKEDVLEEASGLYVEGYGFKVPVPEHIAARLSWYAGKQIVLGLPARAHTRRPLCAGRTARTRC